MEIENGCIVRFIGSSEEFTVSNWDGKRGWAGDEDNRGWYFTEDQVKVVKGAYDDDNDDEDWDDE